MQALEQKAGDMAKLSSTSSNAEAEADLRREAAHAAEAALLAERRQNSMMRRDQRVLTEVCGLCVRVCVRMFVCVWLCVAVWLCGVAWTVCLPWLTAVPCRPPQSCKSSWRRHGDSTRRCRRSTTTPSQSWNNALRACPPTSNRCRAMVRRRVASPPALTPTSIASPTGPKLAA